jgi:hypothetical protein
LTRIVLSECSTAAQGQGCDYGISHCDSTHGHHPFCSAELGVQRAAQAMSSPVGRCIAGFGEGMRRMVRSLNDA